MRTGSCDGRMQMPAQQGDERPVGVPPWPAGLRPRQPPRRATSRTKVSRASRLVSSTATATMGPNSPMAPTDSIDGPIAVRSTPASRRIGKSVPSAVVVRHSATTTESSTSPVPCSTAPTPSAMTTEAPHEPAARPRCPCRMTPRSNSVPARNMRKVRPKSDSAVTMVLVREVEHEGAEGDPEQDLDHDFGNGTGTACPLGEKGREDSGESDKDKCGDRAVDHACSVRPVTAGSWHTSPPPRHTLRAHSGTSVYPARLMAGLTACIAARKHGRAKSGRGSDMRVPSVVERCTGRAP